MYVPYHPPGEKELKGRAGPEEVLAVFSSCADFARRQVKLRDGGEATLYWLNGMAKTERINDYIIRPLATRSLGRRPEEEILRGGIWTLSVEEVSDLKEAAENLVWGGCLIFLGKRTFSAPVPTEEKRPVSPPENEADPKGADDAFVESVRTNNSLLRRRLRTPFLRLEEHTLGRATKTPVDLVWVEGICSKELVEKVRRRLKDIDVDALLATEDLTSNLLREGKSLFPQLLYTQRPDRFCQGLLDGEVGLLVDGIPQGCLLPVTLLRFLRAPQDRNYHPLAAGSLLALRGVCACITLLLPGFYIAVAAFHFEMIPVKLAQSIVASRQEVPFVTPVEVLMLLGAFEILQEAGLRLPRTIGQTVSIVGGLVVGQAAVDAKIISPVVVIVVAAAGIAGFTVPNQDLVNALRVWRVILAAAASVMGIFGLAAGVCWLICHLGDLALFGVPYLSPAAGKAGVPTPPGALTGLALRKNKLRDLALAPEDLRRKK